MKMNELRTEAKRLGLTAPVGVTKIQLTNMVNTAKLPGGVIPVVGAAREPQPKPEPVIAERPTDDYRKDAEVIFTDYQAVSDKLARYIGPKFRSEINGNEMTLTGTGATRVTGTDGVIRNQTGEMVTLVNLRNEYKYILSAAKRFYHQNKPYA